MRHPFSLALISLYPRQVQLKCGAATDPGLVRRTNQDRYVAELDLRFFAVVDGMGGHAGGELASATVAEAISASIRETAGDPDKTWSVGLDVRGSVLANRLQIAIQGANRALAARAQANADLDGTGATLVAALFGGNELAISNVGDCRAYLLRGGQMVQLTRDHSLVAEQLAQGLIDSDTARTHPLRHVVTRSVSGRPGIRVDIREVPVKGGDRLILCSDGIHDILTDNEIAAFVSADGPSLDDLCRAAIAEANKRSGPDNATAVVVAIDDDEP